MIVVFVVMLKSTSLSGVALAQVIFFHMCLFCKVKSSLQLSAQQEQDVHVLQVMWPNVKRVRQNSANC